VALMGHIYRQCRQVRIWLGCDDSQCDLKRSSCPTSNTDHSLRKADPFELLRILANPGSVCEGLCSNADKFNTMWQGFLAIEQSSWWTRIWTAQEAVLPWEGVFYFDRWTISRRDLNMCGWNYLRPCPLMAQCCQHAISRLPDTARTTLDGFCSIVQSFDDTRIFHPGKDRNVPHDLQSVHIRFGYRACSDPRDKVYGLLGIAEDRLLRADYQLSKEKVFFLATYRMLCSAGGSLKNLTGHQYGPAPGKLASWVRDFDAPSDRMDADITWERYYYLISRTYDASRGHKSSHILLGTLPRSAGGTAQVGLRVVARRVGKVAKVSSEAQTCNSHKDAGTQKHVFKQWVLQALDWGDSDIAAFLDLPDSAQKKSSNLMGFWHTILGGKDIPARFEGFIEAYFNHIPPTTMHWLKLFLAWLTDEDGTLKSELYHYIRLMTHGRCYFNTEDNGQGLCYPHARIGDEVWVLDGGNVPFILRSTYLGSKERNTSRPMGTHEFGSNERVGTPLTRKLRHLLSASHLKLSRALHHGYAVGYYQLIGDCYFDGYMYGAAVRDSQIHAQSIVLV